MILLLDAHALVWWLADDATLSAAARGAISSPSNRVLVSAATVWELAIKRASGKIWLAEELASALEHAGFSGLPITLAEAEAAAALPRHHHDPFDRMLVAQARRIKATIVSRDSALEPYGVPILTA